MKKLVKVLWLFALALAGCSDGHSPEQLEARHRNSLGVVAMDQHNYVRGREHFDAASRLDPAYATAHANLGISLYSLGQYDSARVALEQALRLDVDHLHAAYTLGLIYHAQGRDHELALSLFHKVARRDPDDPLVRYYLGRTHAKLGQVDSALAAFRRVIELDETNVSAHYALAQTLRQNGDLEAWRTTLETFNRLSQSGLEGVSAAYQGQGKYGEAVADTPFGGFAGSPSAVFETGPPPAGLSGDIRYLTAVDADGDGHVDLLTSADDDRPVLLRPLGSGFVPSDDWDFQSVGAVIGVTLADIDSDGDSDAALAGVQHATIARQESGRFQSGQDDFGPCARLVFGDADHDGDADMACADGAIGLWSNDGTGRFRPIGPAAGVQGINIRRLVFSDLDTDRDVDLIAAGERGLHLFSNNRDGTFADIAATRGLSNKDVRDLAVADFDPDGSMDIAIVTANDASLLTNSGTAFSTGPLDLPSGAAGLLTADLDNDGDVDLLSYGTHGIAVAMWAGRFLPAASVSASPTSHLVILDVDSDGRLDLVSPAATHWNRTPSGGSLRVDLAGLNSNPDGFGTRVEVTTATSRQVQEFRGGPGDGPTLHFGIGDEDVEFVRVLWPSGVRQTELDTTHSGRMSLTEVNRKGTSCPILYAWDGERFDFVSDFLGGGIIGYLVGPDEYYMPDTDEYLPLRRLAPTDAGDYVLQIGNQLEEVIYLDGAELVAVDHPEATELYPGERLLSAPPYPQFRPYALAATRALRRIVDHNNSDVTQVLAAIDDVWYTGFNNTPIHGYAERYSLRLELGDLTQWEHPVLLAHGWVDYAHSSSNWAAAEQGLVLQPPRLEARSGEGVWHEVTTDMGVPAGLPKTMLYDLEGVFPSGETNAQLRITTNTPVYWDQFRLGRAVADAETRVHRRPFTKADLHWRGYPAHEAIHGTFAFRYDYDNVNSDGGWSTHGGAFTRYGAVDELVHDIDDRFVVMFHGDELTLEVAADSFLPIKPGWSRTFLFYADGFGKDMDLHSAHSLTVEPLPFHGMSRYPYGALEAYPSTPEHVDYVLNYNTRWIKGYYR